MHIKAIVLKLCDRLSANQDFYISGAYLRALLDRSLRRTPAQKTVRTGEPAILYASVEEGLAIEKQDIHFQKHSVQTDSGSKLPPQKKVQLNDATSER